MADFEFNISKGRAVELYKRVEENDPAGAAFVLIPCSAGDTEANAQDADTVTAALATAINEQTGGGWVRKVLTDAELAAFPAPNDVDNRNDIQLPVVTWTTPSIGYDTTHLLVAYDAVAGSGTDADLIPVGLHAFAVLADGNDVIKNIGDFLRAS